MTSLLLLTALALGMRHALDPDHLVAVSTLVAEERRLWPAARLGLVWGAGHLLPIALLGLPVLLLRLEVPPLLEDWVDLGVGVLLVGLGVRTFWRLRQEQAGFHGHTHPYVQGQKLTFLIGMVHGLAGSGAAAVLALTAAPGIGAGVWYLLVFGVGTCAGMFLTTLGIAAPAMSVAGRFERLSLGIRLAAGTASIAMGGVMWVDLLPRVMA